MKPWRMFPFWLLGIVIFLNACSDLSNIRKFASASADSASYTALITDYEKSAERLKGYEPPGVSGKLDRTIEVRKAQQQPLLDLLHGIQSYMNALGALASDQLVSYDESLSAVTDGLKATKVISETEADAFDSLAKLLAKAATDSYRQTKLKLIIREANPHFQNVVKALVNIVGKDFVASLDTEKEGANKHFADVIENASHAPPQDAAIELVREAWHQRLDDIDTRRQACLIYAEALEAMAKGHQTLFDHAEKLSSTQLLSAISSYGTSIAQMLTQLQQLK